MILWSRNDFLAGVHSVNLLLLTAKIRLLHFTRLCGNSIKVRWAKLVIYVKFFMMLDAKSY